MSSPHANRSKRSSRRERKNSAQDNAELESNEGEAKILGKTCKERPNHRRGDRIHTGATPRLSFTRGLAYSVQGEGHPSINDIVSNLMEMEQRRKKMGQWESFLPFASAAPELRSRSEEKPSNYYREVGSGFHGPI
jgi:hypothetical protein